MPPKRNRAYAINRKVKVVGNNSLSVQQRGGLVALWTSVCPACRLQDHELLQNLLLLITFARLAQERRKFSGIDRSVKLEQVAGCNDTADSFDVREEEFDVTIGGVLGWVGDVLLE